MNEMEQMKVLISVSNEDHAEFRSGIMSSVAWNNPEIYDALDVIFRTRPHEQIEAILVDNEGIKAKFKIVGL